ncbi:hypothetical protein Q3G72_000192 [Acer saccharum]|nr:hypothetical protein Q3G72_000192 [Acer saccharum]
MLRIAQICSEFFPRENLHFVVESVHIAAMLDRFSNMRFLCKVKALYNRIIKFRITTLEKWMGRIRFLRVKATSLHRSSPLTIKLAKILQLC